MSKATTKFAIAFAFKELLLEKSIDKITINDISRDNGIGTYLPIYGDNAQKCEEKVKKYLHSW